MLSFPTRLPSHVWLSLLQKSIADASLGLPGFPSKELQEIWVGRSGAETLTEASKLYELIKSHRPTFDNVLDFGSGWGRVSRFFLNDIPPDRIYGVDTSIDILNECARIGVPGDYRLIEPLSVLPFEDEKFDVIFAYSVFTHLSERSAAHWIPEIRRALKPGGIFVPTLIGETILKMCEAGTYPRAKPSLKTAASWFGNSNTLLQRYRNGDFIFSRDRDSDLYGWASVPVKYIDWNWGFKRIEFLDNLGFAQGAVVLQKSL